MLVRRWTEDDATPIGVLLVDDQQAMLRGLEILIDGEQPRMRVVGAATARDDALALATALQPDVVLLDLDLDGESSLDFLPELLACCTAAVLVFTGVRDVQAHARALREGAVGIVMKEEKADVLLDAIERSSRFRRASRPLRNAAWNDA